MCELFALSSKLATKATFSLAEFSRHGGATGPHCDGWGLAFYEHHYAHIYRDETPAAFSEWMSFLQNHQHASHCVISHIRKATQGVSALRNTQPFSRAIAGHRHVFCHNGHLKQIQTKLTLEQQKPIGETDSEYAFCYLMEKISPLWAQQTPTLEQRSTLINEVFQTFAKLGPANFLYSDGDYLYAFANKRTQANGEIAPPGLYYLLRQCDKDQDSTPLTGVNLEQSTTSNQQLVLFASTPLSSENWQAFKENQLIVARNGKILSQ